MSFKYTPRHHGWYAAQVSHGTTYVVLTLSLLIRPVWPSTYDELVSLSKKKNSSNRLLRMLLVTELACRNGGNDVNLCGSVLESCFLDFILLSASCCHALTTDDPLGQCDGLRPFLGKHNTNTAQHSTAQGQHQDNSAQPNPAQHGRWNLSGTCAGHNMRKGAGGGGGCYSPRGWAPGTPFCSTRHRHRAYYGA